MIQIDVQMPEKCGLCPCFHHDNPMYCQAVKADKNKKIVSPYGSPRPEWCPLKEQKAVKPVLVGHMWECGNCHAPVGIYLDDRRDDFCRKCGKKVQWDG